MASADGSIVIVANVEDKKAIKQLDNLAKKVENAQEQLSGTKNLTFNLDVSQADKEIARLNSSIRKLEENVKVKERLSLDNQNDRAMNRVYYRMAITSGNDEEAKRLTKEYDKLATKAKAYADQIKEANTKLSVQKEEIGKIAEAAIKAREMAKWHEAAKPSEETEQAYERLKEAGNEIAEATEESAENTAEAAEATDAMAEGTKKAKSSADKFANRIKAVVRSALVFTVITKALSGFRDWVGDVVKATPEASAAVAKLKGALLTMVQPLVNVIIPAFTALINVLTAVVSKIAQFFAALSGTTVESSAQAAEALYEQTEALDGTGSAAKKAGKSLASFDEINKLSSNESSGSGSSKNEIEPDFGFNTEIDELLQKIAADVFLIAAGLALWKIADKLPENLSGIASKIGLIAVAVGGLILFWLGLKDAWENGVDWGNFALMLGGAAIAALALYKAFGKVGAGISLIITGAAMIVTAFKDIVENGANLQNTLLLIAGIVATGLGFFLLTGSTIPLVIAGIASIVVAVLALTGNLEDFMVNLKENILGGLIDFIKGLFTGDWEMAWQGIKKIFYGIISGIVMIFESAVNLIIKGLNWLIDKMNALLAESFIAKGLELVGVHFTGIPNIPTVDLVSNIPALAKGAVIPPNREFLAVLGDQKQGTNIETPLNTMVQAFRMALSEGGYGGQNEAVLEIDGETFGRLVYRMNKAESTRVGVNLSEV